MICRQILTQKNHDSTPTLPKPAAFCIRNMPPWPTAVRKPIGRAARSAKRSCRRSAAKKKPRSSESAETISAVSGCQMGGADCRGFCTAVWHFLSVLCSRSMERLRGRAAFRPKLRILYLHLPSGFRAGGFHPLICTQLPAGGLHAGSRQ